MCDNMYIIAYHGNQDQIEARAKRLDNHNKQIDWWLEYDSKLIINILAMNYNDYEYYQHDRVKYVDKLYQPIPPASGRNVLLKSFYESDDEWAIFADSDAILNMHPNFEHTHINIVDILRTYPNNFDGIDLFWPHWDGRPGDGAFYDKYNNVDPLYKDVNWNTELRFDRKFGSMKGTLFFLRNNKTIYMDEVFNGSDEVVLIPGEDDEFSIACAMSGMGTYILRNIMLKEFTAPSTHAGAQNTRKAEMDKGDVIITTKYNLPEDRAKWYRQAKQLGYGMPKTVVTPFITQKQINPLFDF